MLPLGCGLIELYCRFDKPLPVTQFILVSFSFSPMWPPHMPLALSLVNLNRSAICCETPSFLHRQTNLSYRSDQQTYLFQHSRSLNSLEQYSVCVSAIATMGKVIPIQPSSQRSTKNHLHHNYVDFLINASIPCYGFF